MNTVLKFLSLLLLCAASQAWAEAQKTSSGWYHYQCDNMLCNLLLPKAWSLKTQSKPMRLSLTPPSNSPFSGTTLSIKLHPNRVTPQTTPAQYKAILSALRQQQGSGLTSSVQWQQQATYTYISLGITGISKDTVSRDEKGKITINAGHKQQIIWVANRHTGHIFIITTRTTTANWNEVEALLQPFYQNLVLR